MEKTKKLPIILVPGMAFDYAMRYWKWLLSKDGYDVEIARLYCLLAIKSVQEQAQMLDDVVAATLKKYKADKCHLIGGSLGTVVSLYFVQKMPGGQKVEKCICLVPPFNGIAGYLCWVAPLGFFIRGLEEILPGSELLRGLWYGSAGDTEVFVVCGEGDWTCPMHANLPCTCGSASINGGHILIYCGLNSDVVSAVRNFLK